MSFIILCIIAGLVALFLIGGLVFSTERGAFAGGLAVLVVVFGVLSLIMSMTTVDARSVAIVQGFGRYQDTRGPGLQLIKPWESTEEFTTRLQDVDLNDKDGSKKDSVYVSFSAPKEVTDAKDKSSVAGGGNGNINAIVRWQINPDKGNGGAKALWEKYKTFNDVSTRLVLSESQQAVTDVANDYPADYASVNQQILGDQVKQNLIQRLGKYGILVDSVSIKGVDLDDPTKASLQRIQDNYQKTRAAQQEQERAKIDNETAKLRQQSGVLSASNMQRYCLDVVNNWDVSKNGPLPATFDCSLGGSGKNVLVNAGK